MQAPRRRIRPHVTACEVCQSTMGLATLGYCYSILASQSTGIARISRSVHANGADFPSM